MAFTFPMKEGERSLDVFQLVGKITINGQSEFDSAVSGMTKTAKKLAKATAAAATAVGTAMVAIGKKSFEAYAEYEQLFGGVEAMFANNAAAQEKVVSTSKKAWQDLTMSQNDYYKSFMSSYPLVKASMEDQNEAIDTTNRLLTLTSDLANTFGGDISNYSNAINWALKGTYSYLDNLNIGIAGTAEGFLEAANNSGLFDKNLKSLDELTSDQKIAVIEHYAEQYGVLGRTAAEAAGTITGSVSMMKAAWNNLLIGFADETQDVSVLVGEFLSSCVTMAENVVPRIIQIFHGIVEAVPDIVEQVKGYLIAEFPALEGVFAGLGAVVDWVKGKLDGFTSWCKANPAEVEAVVTIIASFAAAWALVTGVVNTTIVVLTAVNVAIAFLSSPIGIAVAAVGILIAIVVTLVTHWEEVKAACAELGENLANGFQQMCQNVVDNVNKMKEEASAKWSAFKETVGNIASSLASKAVSKFNEVKSSAVSKFEEMKANATSKVSEMQASIAGTFDAIKSGIQSKIEGARDAVKAAIDKLRSFFNFSWSLPHLALPHISISGSFSLNPPAVPTFGISWYKKAYENAMVLSNPTIFGYSPASGKMLGGGEGNGNEVVAGEAHLMGMIQDAVAAQNESLATYLQELIDMLADYLPQVIAASGHDIVTNDGAIIATYAPKFNTALGRISKGKDRGR